MCFKSVRRVHTHAHTCIFDLLRKKSRRAGATVSPINPCVVGVESGAKKIVNFRHFFFLHFSSLLVSSACHSHSHIIHIHTHTPSADRE